MLFKLSVKNITKSIKDYAIYFFTIMLGVAVFYVFNALDSQTAMMEVSSNTADIMQLMTTLLSGISVFISLVLGGLIIYASRFLMKRRNKEFGIYLTLGMSKSKISRMLFLETLLIGFISLAVGLVVGIVASQLMSVLVVNMFEADMTSYRFTFSSSATIKCIIYFSIMYVFVMIFNTISVSKCKLIDLIYSGKKNEEVKMKNPVISVIVFLIAIVVLSAAYYMVTGGINGMIDNKIFIPITMGAVSTFFIFWSVSGLLIRIVMSAKGVYYKGLNTFILRQLSSKVNTMVMSMTVICLMLFVTICTLSASFSMKESLNNNLTKYAPCDIQISKINPTYYDMAEQQLYDDFRLSINETLINNGFDINSLQDIALYTLCQDKQLTWAATLGDAYDKVYSEYGSFMRFDTPEQIMSISDYNNILSAYGKEAKTLNDDEYMIIADYENMAVIRNAALEIGATIELNGVTLKPKYNKCIDGFIDMGANAANTGVIIVPDYIVDNDNIDIILVGEIANYNATSEPERKQIEKQLTEITSNTWETKTSLLAINSKLNIIESAIGLGAIVTFIGMYLGIIFLISSAAILALKELSESTDNKERYNMLRRIGADEKMINKALFTQIGVFFVMPLTLAIIHSVFGIKFANFILSTVGVGGLLMPIIITAAIIVLIYGGYFLLTYFCSKNIIKD